VSAHAAGVLLEHPVGGVGEIELAEELGRARFCLAAAQAAQTYGGLLREAISDLLEPRGDASRAYT
jgi:hypothetical protein